jgi:5'-phosphate synthase pdxT subunit
MGPSIGVLALQGAFEPHQRRLEQLGASVRQIRRPEQLDGLHGLVIPGGESTTMSMLLESSGLYDGVGAAIDDGVAVLGTCAGMILLATEVLDGRDDQRCLGAIDITVRRNGYGRQRQSFETDLAPRWSDDVAGDSVGSPLSHDRLRAVFIRAPRVERWADHVEVAAYWDGAPVLMRQGAVVVAAFHPELTDDDRVHRWFLDIVAKEVV